MKRLLFFLVVSLALIISPSAYAGVATFDDLTLASESYWNGSDGSGGFTNGGAVFKNYYNPTYSSWGGWAYSNMTDTTTAGIGNQYSACTGGGEGGSSNYGVAYDSAFGSASPPNVSFGSESYVYGAYFTNTTYTALSMRDGDAFAKKFGGASGDDPDWFLLTIEGFDENGASSGTVGFYLADYRSVDNADDYILNTWEWVDLTSLGYVKKLTFSLTSSDNGAWGMNTPAYFAMDGLNAVPVPAAVWLLLSGCICLLGIKKRVF